MLVSSVRNSIILCRTFISVVDNKVFKKNCVVADLLVYCGNGWFMDHL